ncbi:13707_t:CDS:2, partial [Entrophospora sp. SA101]
MNTQINNAEGTSGPTSKGGIAENSTDANKKRDRGGGWPQLEEALLIW